jgi:hypothetical protein
MDPLSWDGMEETRALCSAELMQAIKDSVWYPSSYKQPSPHSRHRSSPDLVRSEARRWIEEGSQVTGANGHGFGYIWSTLHYLGVIQDFNLETFQSKMRVLWRAADQDHSIGAKVSTMIQGILNEAGGEKAVITNRASYLAGLIRDAA